jgi:hypothetical protein
MALVPLGKVYGAEQDGKRKKTRREVLLGEIGRGVGGRC